jgi:hypothetical protein
MIPEILFPALLKDSERVGFMVGLILLEYPDRKKTGRIP